MFEPARFEGREKANAYLLALGDRGLVVDPSDQVREISAKARDFGCQDMAIFLTGGSFAHGVGAEELRSEWGARLYAALPALTDLHRFPVLAEEAGLCGVYTPQVTKIIRESQELRIGAEVVHLDLYRDRFLILKVGKRVFLGSIFEERDGKLYENGTLKTNVDPEEIQGLRFFPGKGFPFDAK